MIGANLSNTVLTHSESEKDVIEFLILFNDSVSDDLKDNMSIALMFLLFTVLATGLGLENGNGTVKIKWSEIQISSTTSEGDDSSGCLNNNKSSVWPLICVGSLTGCVKSCSLISYEHSV